MADITRKDVERRINRGESLKEIDMTMMGDHHQTDGPQGLAQQMAYRLLAGQYCQRLSDRPT